MVTLNLNNGKNGQAKGRARVCPDRAAIAAKNAVRITVVLKTLLDALGEDDIEAVVRVYREAMNATRYFWRESGRDERGKSIGEWVSEPDHRTRISAANMVAAYMEGLPVQRQIQMRGDFVELGELLKDANRSGEARRLLNGFNSLPSGTERSE